MSMSSPRPSPSSVAALEASSSGAGATANTCPIREATTATAKPTPGTTASTPYNAAPTSSNACTASMTWVATEATTTHVAITPSSRRSRGPRSKAEAEARGACWGHWSCN